MRNRYRNSALLILVVLVCLEFYRTGQDRDPSSASIVIEKDKIIGTVDKRYVSFAFDTTQAVGGYWWKKENLHPNQDNRANSVGKGKNRVQPFPLMKPELIKLSAMLAPAYFRVGGTEADSTRYDEFGADANRLPASIMPAESKRVSHQLTPKKWDEIHEFIDTAGFDLMFTANAGPTFRENGKWKSDGLSGLVTHVKRKQQSVPIWELGNELNGFFLNYGLRNQPSGKQYASDYETFKSDLKKFFPKARFAGPSPNYWAIIGEPLWPISTVMKNFLRNAKENIDILTWHFYMTQSDRCAIATRRASLEKTIDVRALNQVGEFAQEIKDLRDRWSPDAELWLGETAIAQCGGQEGLSDRYVSGMAWLDMLGSVAKRDHKVVVRQTLIGSDYGIIGAEYTPNPDYWNSFYWKKFMGERVLHVRSNDEKVRAYSHCAPAGFGKQSLSLLVLNFSSVTKKIVHTNLKTCRTLKVRADPTGSKNLALSRRLLVNNSSPTVDDPLVAQVDQSDCSKLEVGPLEYVFALSDMESACKRTRDKI